MKIAFPWLFILPWLLLMPKAYSGETGFQTDHVILYQPSEAMSERVPDVSLLATYIQKLQKECSTYFIDAKSPETLQIVIAVKPGKQSRVWLISSTLPAGDKTRDALVKKLEAVPALTVAHGPVVFAISAKIAGGDGKAPHETLPIPQEWKDAVKNPKAPLVMPDGVLSLVWPDSK